LKLATGVQEIIEVDVGFYDEEEKHRLLALPCSQAMEQIVLQPLQLPTAEFLAYYLFHRKRLGIPGYRDYQAIGYKLNVALAAIDECLDLNGVSISTPQGAKQQLNEISEHVGEAIGLGVANRIHNLTEADWDPIDQQRGPKASPTFDFQIASTGQKFVQVENKGSSVEDNRIISDAVRLQKARVAEKKAKLQELAKAGKDPFSTAIRYGTITVIDPRRDGRARCWLVDPPPDEISQNPRVFRLLERMRFLFDWISLLSVRSPLAAALATRLADLSRMKDPFELDNSPLLHGNGEPFDLSPYNPPIDIHSRFFATKSKITDGPAGGIIVQLSEKALFLLGIRQDLVELAAQQNFENILSFKFPSVTIEKRVQCLISAGRARQMTLPPSVETETVEGYVTFLLDGRIHYSPGGLVFGVLSHA
jgi:hypothetical protein